MEGYNVTIKETSQELTAKERIAIKDLTNAIKLENVADDDPNSLVIKPVAYAILSVHNEHSKDNTDYNVYVITGDDGYRYKTGSDSFFDAFKNIWEEMENENEDWSIQIFKRPSKNYDGKFFLTCAIV